MRNSLKPSLSKSAIEELEGPLISGGEEAPFASSITSFCGEAGGDETIPTGNGDNSAGENASGTGDDVVGKGDGTIVGESILEFNSTMVGRDN